MSLAAAAEAGSSHLIAKAFESIEISRKAECVSESAGHGLEAEIGGKKILVGNAGLLQMHGVAFTAENGAYTQVYVASDGVYAGRIEIGDRIREEAKPAIEMLKELGAFPHRHADGRQRGKGEERGKRAGDSGDLCGAAAR